MRRLSSAWVGVGLLLLAHSTVLRADESSTRLPGTVVQRVGFTEDQFPGTAARDAAVAIDYWFKLITERQQIPQVPNTTVYPTFHQMRQALEMKQLDIVSILSLDYLRVRDAVDLEPFSVATRGVDAYTEYAIYVRKDGEIRTLDQLAGQRIIIDGSEGAELGHFWLDTLLLRNGLDPAEHSNIETVDRASRAILPVFFNQAAACVAAVHSFENMREMNPKVGADLAVLEQSGPLLSGLVCFTPEIGAGYKPDIVQTMNRLHEDPQGQQVLNLFRRDKTVPFESNHLDSVLALVEERRQLEAARGNGASIP